MDDYVPSTLIDTGDTMMNKTQSLISENILFRGIHKEIISRSDNNSNLSHKVHLKYQGIVASSAPEASGVNSQGRLPRGRQTLEQGLMDEQGRRVETERILQDETTKYGFVRWHGAFDKNRVWGDS